jgi:hypothetical protein
MDNDDFRRLVADCVDRRKKEISLVLRVVANEADTVLEQTASIMAIPVLYAHWEGFVKEVVGEYIEFIEKQNLVPAQAHPTIFSFSMRKNIKLIRETGSVEHMTDFAIWMVEASSSPVRFEDKSVETGGNLSYKNLKELCDNLKIDVAALEADRRKIDALLNRRNNIAHTGRPPKFDQMKVAEDSALVIGLIDSFESILCNCVDLNRYLIDN